MFSLSKMLMVATSEEHRSSVMLFIIVGGGCFCFLAMSNDSLLEETTVSNAMSHGPLTRIVVVASITLAILVILNLLVDFYVAMMKQTTTKTKSTISKDILTKSEKLIFMLGIVIPPIASCFTGWNKATLLFACTICMQQQFIFGIMITSLNRFNDHYFPSSMAYAVILLVTAASIVRPYGINTCAASSITVCNKLPITMFQLNVGGCAGFILSLLVSFWLSSLLMTQVYGEKVTSQYYRWPTWSYLHHYVPSMKSTTTSSTEKQISSAPYDDGLLYFRIIHCITIILWSYPRLTTTIDYKLTQIRYFYQFNDYELMLVILPSVVFQLSILFFDIRLVKHEAVSALLALIEAKKTYVRYISHELRTPLSAANAGLHMLQEELTFSAKTNPVDEERLDTLNDVCSAISTTVDILNDLLLFEKMER